MLTWLLGNTFVAAALAAGLWLALRRARPRPALAHALWLVVLVKLATPPVLHWPWSLPVGPAAPPVAAEPEPVPAAEPIVVEWTTVEPPATAERPVRFDPGPTADAPAPAPPAPAAPAAPGWDLGTWLLAVWLAGAGVVALRRARQAYRLAREVTAGIAAPADLAREVTEIAGRLGVRPPRVRVLAGLPTPAVCGLWRPVLLWPDGLERRLPEAGLRAVLAHELAHLRRRDHWVRWLELAVGVLHWWDPLFRLVRRQVREQAELACDARVVELWPAARRAFAEALLEVCETTNPSARPAPAVGAGGDGAHEFQRRLTMILRTNPTGPLPRRSLAIVGLLALLALPAWTLGQPAPPKPAEPAKPAEGQIQPYYYVSFVDSGTVEHLDPREKKIQELEQKLNALVKELKELRGAPKADKADNALHREAEQALYAWTVSQAQAEYSKKLSQAYAAGVEDREISLTRVSYALPAGKAEALAGLLKDTKGGVLETTVQGDKLIVTTSPERQNAIGQFVSLIQGKASAADKRAKEFYWTEKVKPEAPKK
jgi:beta-lactamase regulating signal transducer with metallopeptidase domain